MIELATEKRSPRYADLDLWSTPDAVAALCEDQIAGTEALRSKLGAIAAAADAAAASLARGHGRLIHVGAGTSGRIAVQDGVELGPTYDWPESRWAFLLAGGSEALLRSVEGAEDDEAAAAEAMRGLDATSDDVVIGVAASGRTVFTVAAVRAAAAAGALTIGIANNADTPLLEAAAHPILLDTGAEVVAGSTRMKAGTAQKIALNLLSTAVMLRLGRVYDGRMVSMRASNRKLRQRAAKMVGEISGVALTEAEAALERAGGSIKRAVLIARGLDPAAAEDALGAAGDNLRIALDRLRSNAPPRR